MGGLWRKAAESSKAQTEIQSCLGSIEMKGTEPAVSQHFHKRQWQGFWSASEPSPTPTRKRSSQPSITPEPCILDTCVRANSDSNLECKTVGLQRAQSCGQDIMITRSMDRPTAGNDCDQDLYEVKMLLRIPRSHKASSQTDGDTQSELAAANTQLQDALKALQKKNEECENLIAVVKELTESRAKLTSLKSIQSEKIADLQEEYIRAVRVAELSRSISKDNIAKTAQITVRLNQVEEELARQKALNQQTKERYAKQKIDNMDLREKLSLIERLDLLAFRRESACMVEFHQLHLKETY